MSTIEILDRNFKRLDILRHYTFSQYNMKFRGIGTFTVNAPLELNTIFLNREEQYYLLFNGNVHPVVGKVEDVKKESEDEENKLTITGRLALFILTKRIVSDTINTSGTTLEHMEKLVTENILKVKNNRYIPITIDDSAVNKNKLSKVDRQVTGGYIWDEFEELLEQDKIGVELYPKIVPTYSANDIESSILGWTLKFSSGIDRTKGNVDGNVPVIFSQQLSNINRVDYERNVENHCNIAYIAGEGEGNNRKWFEIPINQEESQETKGWERSELWIDARDIQSEDNDGNQLTDEQYNVLIQQRAEEKAVENDIQESYEATVITKNKRYVYGKDYFLGDFVTVVDTQLGLEFDVQIVGITFSKQDTEEITDIELQYGNKRISPQSILQQNKRKTEQNSNDIRYILTKIK
jgi:hypothetical protein|nr:MAG TPA: hypothetical protein [Caudoviricetes sp.]